MAGIVAAAGATGVRVATTSNNGVMHAQRPEETPAARFIKMRFVPMEDLRTEK